MKVAHCLSAVLLIVLMSGPLPAQQNVIPHHQDKPPGPPLSPQEAMHKMELPEGFTVELVASEPDVVNPVAMCFDEQGRIWLTESLEYPRRPAGPGRDRVKVLEDTDSDGRADKFTVFADGFNIPSGIAVGYGGVWVANSPDILFLQDTDGDGRADTREVVVTGFGRTDTHELPNSLTWGPDGWLYGLNGVFNHSHVNYSPSNPNYDPQHPGWSFTCAMFRIHPRTREFQLFAEGTSNPWGIALDTEGSAFISACVIDHLWHITETGYYHRQGGPYPPFTWKIGSIVDHKHQKAAYCGLEFFDSDAYPSQYRDRLYMGNIHGNCINVDRLSRNGSTYRGEGEPDFLTAHDAWFMPVSQKTGPDGCLYILDWYDRYHCYQDANRDPQGIDRGKGRLYRIRYKNTPRAENFNLAAESDDRLIERLHSPNVYFRRQVQRLLAERNHPPTRPKLEALVLNDNADHKSRMHALWALLGAGPLDVGFHLRLLSHSDSSLRAWGVRAAGNRRRVEPEIQKRIVALADDPSRDVQVQVAIASRKLEGIDPVSLLMDVLRHCGEDPLIPHIVWQNLYPLLENPQQVARFLEDVEAAPISQSPGLKAVLPRAVERLLGGKNSEPKSAGRLCALVLSGNVSETAAECLHILTRQVQSGEITGRRLTSLRSVLEPSLKTILVGNTDAPLGLPAALLAASWNEPAAVSAVRDALTASSRPEPQRLAAAEALIAADDSALFPAVEHIFADRKANSLEFRGRLIASLGRLKDAKVADVLLAHYGDLEPQLQPRVVALLTQRVEWAKRLLKEIGADRVPANALNLNQVRNLLATRDVELSEYVKKHWGVIRDERDADREKTIAHMKRFIREHPGDPSAGRKVFERICAQCHKIYGQGEDVGPDLTSNGRNSYEQLLSNVFDPNLVIGAAYQAHTAVTSDGRVLTGLLVEDTEQRIVLKVQGGKLETVPKSDVELVKASDVSMMPEKLENQLSPTEIADLFSFITLDRPPEDPQARRLPGVYAAASEKNSR